jgi:ribonuclease HI
MVGPAAATGKRAVVRRAASRYADAMAQSTVTIYSDGACLGNPGPGGYGTVLLFGAHRKELSAGFRRTTNNRMELLGAIVGLEALTRPCQVVLWSDSQYVVHAFTKGWIDGWQRRGWRTRSARSIGASRS